MMNCFQTLNRCMLLFWSFSLINPKRLGRFLLLSLLAHTTCIQSTPCRTLISSSSMPSLSPLQALFVSRSLPLFTSFLIYFFCSTEANKPIYKTFEPLLASVLQTYMSSHDVETKQVALSMLSQLSKFGVPNSSSFHRFVRKNQDRRKKKSRRNL